MNAKTDYLIESIFKKLKNIKQTKNKPSKEDFRKFIYFLMNKS